MADVLASSPAGAEILTDFGFWYFKNASCVFLHITEVVWRSWCIKGITRMNRRYHRHTHQFNMFSSGSKSLFPDVYITWNVFCVFQASRRYFAMTFIGSILWIGVFSYLMVWWAHQVGWHFTQGMFTGLYIHCDTSVWVQSRENICCTSRIM